MIQARILEEISCCWQISLPYHQKLLNNVLFSANVCRCGFKRLRPQFQTFAAGIANVILNIVCFGSVEKTWGRFLNEAYLRCTYLRGQMLNEGFSRKRLWERLQCFASERGKTGAEIVSPILDERKGGSIRVTIVPRKIVLSGQEPR